MKREGLRYSVSAPLDKRVERAVTRAVAVEVIMNGGDARSSAREAVLAARKALGLDGLGEVPQPFRDIAMKAGNAAYHKARKI